MNRIDNHLISLATIIAMFGVSSLDGGVATPFCCRAFSTWPPPVVRPRSAYSPTRGQPPAAAARNPSAATTTTLLSRSSFSPRRTAPSPPLLLRASSSSSPPPPSGKKTKPPPLPKGDDPFLLLGMGPTSDAREIKRAYRKRAMRYHPDVILTTESTPKERDEASKDFARINAAYEMLAGGVGGGGGSSSTGGSATSSGGYTPPHRRQSGYYSPPSSSSSTSAPPGAGGKSTNWEDYMPKYDEENAKYDAGGDTFGSIFSDLITGAAGYAVGVSGGGGGGGGGFVGDLIDFLERNVDGFESGYDDDKALSRLLQYGEFDEVASEMDETDILVSSLETKLNTVENDVMQAQADLVGAIKFSERLDIDERIAELKARDNVVRGYLKKGKKRLIRLRERYKELMVQGRGGRGYGGGGTTTSAGGSGSAADSSRAGSSRSSGRRSESAESPPSPAASSAASTPPASGPPPAPPSSSSAKSWRTEGFTGSYGRTSSGSRRSSRSSRGQGQEEASADDRSTGGADQPSTNAGQRPNQQQQRRTDESANSSGGGSGSGSSDTRTTTTTSGTDKLTPPLEPWVPPHRRTQSSAERDTHVKKRLRELKVDDDFEKLKREMGM